MGWAKFQGLFNWPSKMWSNLSILQPHYSIITRLINPLNCTLPPSDMHQCESDYVWPLLQYSPATIKTSPCGHSSPSFLSSSQSHYNYHPPYSISFSVFFIALFSTVETFGIYLLSPPSSASSSPLLSSLLPPPPMSNKNQYAEAGDSSRSLRATICSIWID